MPGDSPNDERRPVAGGGGHVEAGQADSRSVLPNRAAVLRRRAEAAARLGPVDGRHGPTLAALDPLLSWPPRPRMPLTYGLTRAELRHEAERLVESGWVGWEVVAVLVSPTVAA